MSVSARVLRDAEGEVSGAVVGLHDVTGEVLMQNRIRRSEELFRTAMVEAPQGMAIANAQDHLTDVNPALVAILGAEKVEILGLRLADFVVAADPPVPSCAERLIASGESRIVQHEHELLRPDGPRAWIEHSVSAIRDEHERAQLFVHHVVDVTERRLRDMDLGFRADHDVLTGLLNRDGLLSGLSERVPVRGAHGLAVLYCDLDNLKPINDQHGHAAGDAVLVEVARRLDSGLRRGDIVARIGGDEFVIVLDRIASAADAMSVADKLCRAARGTVAFDDIELAASVSMGIAIAEPTDTVESLLGRADQALYRAKTGGRGRVSR
jgi:diguanylate cyclase (GGDEF)-like protein/PAS domain S-box-containing protein